MKRPDARCPSKLFLSVTVATPSWRSRSLFFLPSLASGDLPACVLYQHSSDHWFFCCAWPPSRGSNSSRRVGGTGREHLKDQEGQLQQLPAAGGGGGGAAGWQQAVRALRSSLCHLRLCSLQGGGGAERLNRERQRERGGGERARSAQGRGLPSRLHALFYGRATGVTFSFQGLTAQQQQQQQQQALPGRQRQQAWLGQQLWAPPPPATLGSSSGRRTSAGPPAGCWAGQRAAHTGPCLQQQ